MPFRGVGHGVIEIIFHMNYLNYAVPLRLILVGHGVINIIRHICYVDVAVLLRVGVGVGARRLKYFGEMNNLNLRHACPCPPTIWG